MLNDTITLNPSLLSFQSASALAGTYNWRETPAGPGNPDNGDHILNASVIDGTNEYVDAGLSFTRRPDADFVHLGLAKRVLSFLGVGLMAKRYDTRVNSVGVNGQSITGIDGGASLSVVPPEGFLPVPIQLGLVSDNLIHRAADEILTGPRQLGGGIKINIQKILLLYGDLVENFSYTLGTYPLYSGGAEIAAGGGFFLRGGLEGFRQTGWGAGAGWVGPKFGVSYGYQSTITNAARLFSHAVTLDVFM